MVVLSDIIASLLPSTYSLSRGLLGQASPRSMGFEGSLQRVLEIQVAQQELISGLKTNNENLWEGNPYLSHQLLLFLSFRKPQYLERLWLCFWVSLPMSCSCTGAQPGSATTSRDTFRVTYTVCPQHVKKDYTTFWRISGFSGRFWAAMQCLYIYIYIYHAMQKNALDSKIQFLNDK